METTAEAPGVPGWEGTPHRRRDGRRPEHGVRFLRNHRLRILRMVDSGGKSDIAEGCWRLSVLLDSLKLSEDLNVQFPAVFKLYEAIKHMPILSARKKLDKQSRMKLDLERMKIEAELAEDIRRDISLLHQYANERNSMLSQ